MANQGNDARRTVLATASDARAVRTRRQIIEALGTALEDGGRVSVVSICERAGIARSTFYTHFKTVDDVVVAAIDQLLEVFVARDLPRRLDPARQRLLTSRLGVEDLLTLLATERAIFAYALTLGAASHLRSRLAKTLAARFTDAIQAERPDAPESFIGTAASYFANGTLGVVFDWFDDPASMGQEQLIEVLVDLLPGWLVAD